MVFYNIKGILAEFVHDLLSGFRPYASDGSGGKVAHYSRLGGGKSLFVHIHTELSAVGGMMRPGARRRNCIALGYVRHSAYQHHGQTVFVFYFANRISGLVGGIYNGVYCAADACLFSCFFICAHM